MTATDELCRMLEERGVEHEGGERSVRWRDRNGVMMQAFPLANGELGMGVWSCTPAQAIAATLGNEGVGRSNDGVAELGAGTCHDSNKRFNAWQCSECGATLLLAFDDCGEPTYSVDGVADVPRYCPNCGRRIVGPTTNGADAEVTNG